MGTHLVTTVDGQPWIKGLQWDGGTESANTGKNMINDFLIRHYNMQQANVTCV